VRSARWVISVLMVRAVAAPSHQPIAYSHKQHIALGLQCVDCHISADTGGPARIPSVRQCMLCHAKVATAKPEIRKLAAFAATKREVPWQRVYGFPRESLVKFQHAPHARAGIGCVTCHGDMTQASTAELLVKHTMGTCLSCHRQNRASEDCTACHY
jgi:Cytochrome c7 and related cytochrome c